MWQERRAGRPRVSHLQHIKNLFCFLKGLFRIDWNLPPKFSIVDLELHVERLNLWEGSR